jgi:1-acyl-sn-glycerol-3-phosphate acyltransferase
MWIGSPLRGAFRLLSYLSVTLVLVPIYLLAMALRIRPVIRWMPVVYHRLVCVILGIKVRVHGERSNVIPTLYVCNHVSYLDIEVLGGLIPGSFVARPKSRPGRSSARSPRRSAPSSSSGEAARPAPAATR